MKPKCKINYIGSKHSLLGFINDTIKEYVPDLSDIILCDLFAGTGIVSRYFKPHVKQIISNDIEFYSYVFLKSYIENNAQYNKTDELNSLDGRNGFIFHNYCAGGNAVASNEPIIKRMYFSDNNGRKIDAIRSQIEQWKPHISEAEYYYYICSLVEASDKVANTASVYGAFLKTLKASAVKPIFLEPLEISNGNGVVYNQDANRLITKIHGDILYLDPPYNRREYGANYHLLNTIAKYDEFVPQGISGLRKYVRSDYCSKEKALAALQRLIANAQFKYIFLSYNNEGVLSLRDISNMMNKYGKYELKRKKYNRFKQDKNRTQKHKCTFELLHCLEKK